MARLKILDTNALVSVCTGELTLSDDISAAISIISRIELLAWPDLSQEDRLQVKKMVDLVQTIQITPKIEARTVELRLQRLLKLPDAIIAATALDLQAELVTRDKTFDRVKGLSVERF